MKEEKEKGEGERMERGGKSEEERRERESRWRREERGGKRKWKEWRIRRAKEECQDSKGCNSRRYPRCKHCGREKSGSFRFA